MNSKNLFSNRLKQAFLFLLLLLSFKTYAIVGDTAKAGIDTNQVVPIHDTIYLPLPEPKEDSIIVLNFHTVQNGGHRPGLDDYISVRVQNLPGLYASPGHDNDKIVLYINGIAMHGLNPMFENKTGDSLIFKLVRDSVTAKSWAVFYESPRTKNGCPLTLSLGYEHDKPMPTRVKDFSMTFADTQVMWIAGGAILLILGCCILLAMKTSLLRDKVVTPEEPADGADPDPSAPVKKIKNPPYSLARTQIMFWTVVSAVSFIFIWAVTHEIPEITGSTLVLLTVSIGTSASARLIDFTQQDGNTNRHQNTESKGFFQDILSDESGISIHRLQMFLWMLIVGVYFLKVSYVYLYMPELDNTLLALMGISAGAYVGLKIPENKATPPPTPPSEPG